MLVALQYQANPDKYVVEDVALRYHPEVLCMGRIRPVTVINPEDGIKPIGPTRAIVERFRCTYTALRYKGCNIPIYAEII